MSNFKSIPAILLLVFLNIPDGNSQKFLSKEWVELKKANKANKIAEDRFLIMPFIGPTYSPELKFSVAGGMIASFKTNKGDSIIQRSSIPLLLGISSSGGYYMSTKFSTFWLQDKFRIHGDISYKEIPDHYWGVGYDKARYTVKSDSTTAYYRKWWQLNPRILYRLKKNIFGGIIIDYNYTQGSSPSKGVAEDPYYIEYNDQPLNSGVGVIFQYDSRDVTVNAWSGSFIELSASFYNTTLGGNNNYQIYVSELRKFWTIKKKPGRTFAFQVKGRFGRGSVPYGEMSQLGNPFDLRGYTWGRYRNNTLVFGLAEYRHMFYKKSGELSRHGLVSWVGAGTIGQNVTQFEKYLPSFGVGYRIEVQPRMNLRIDFGIGTETYGFYFNFNEAF